jgi:hypothetical protein
MPRKAESPPRNTSLGSDRVADRGEPARLLAQTLYWLKDIVGARAVYETALRRHPEDSTLRLQYGRMLAETGIARTNTGKPTIRAVNSWTGSRPERLTTDRLGSSGRTGGPSRRFLERSIRNWRRSESQSWSRSSVRWRWAATEQHGMERRLRSSPKNILQ